MIEHRLGHIRDPIASFEQAKAIIVVFGSRKARSRPQSLIKPADFFERGPIHGHMP
jgi:hypothetical protein